MRVVAGSVLAGLRQACVGECSRAGNRHTYQQYIARCATVFVAARGVSRHSIADGVTVYASRRVACSMSRRDMVRRRQCRAQEALPLRCRVRQAGKIDTRMRQRRERVYALRKQLPVRTKQCSSLARRAQRGARDGGVTFNRSCRSVTLTNTPSSSFFFFILLPSSSGVMIAEDMAVYKNQSWGMKVHEAVLHVEVKVCGTVKVISQLIIYWYYIDDIIIIIITWQYFRWYFIDITLIIINIDIDISLLYFLSHWRFR